MYKNIHKLHEYTSLEEGATYIKKEIRELYDKLNIDFAQAYAFKLQEIRLKMEKSRMEFQRELEETFDCLSKSINQRKEELLQELNEEFASEMEKIREIEIKWETKDEVLKNIVDLQLQKKDEALLLNCNNILEGLEFIQEKKTTHKFHQFIDLDLTFTLDISKLVSKNKDKGSKTSINMNKITIPHEKFTNLFDEFGKVSKGVPVEVEC